MWSRYLAIGDSVTEGVGDDVVDLKCRSWAEWFAEGLRASIPDLEYRNVASRGATAADVLRDQTGEIRTFRPDLVSVTIGGNDARVPEWTANGFRSEFASILDAATAAGARVITGTYPDIESTIHQAGGEIRPSWRLYFERMHEVNEVIRAVSAEHDAYLMDMEHSEVCDARCISRDFTHPNALGYRTVGKIALDTVTAR